jgi:hypothetical protein
MSIIQTTYFTAFSLASIPDKGRLDQSPNLGNISLVDSKSQQACPDAAPPPDELAA